MKRLHSLTLLGLKATHCQAIKLGSIADLYIANNLITSYAKCTQLTFAHQLFDEMPHRDTVSWNAIISTYANSGHLDTSWQLLSAMRRSALAFDSHTLGSILKGVARAGELQLGQQLHSVMHKMGLSENVFSGSALLDMYAKCGRVDDAYVVFRSMPERNYVSWNALVAGYSRVGDHDMAFWVLSLFDGAFACRDLVTWNSMLGAYLMHEKEDLALKVFIDMQNFGVFFSMGFKDCCTWNSILAGFVQIGLSEEALRLFLQMRSMVIEIDHYTFSAAIRSCSDLATLQLGQQVHALALKVGFDTNKYVGSSLIFMYSKCGIIEDARKSFEATSKDNAIVWNSIIFGYAQHGQGNIALDFFYLMREKRVKPDHITFAKTLVETMPFEPDAMVLKTLLGACRFCNDIELASQVAKTLLEIEPEEHCTYVILSEMYGRFKMWDEKASVTRMMRERGVKKVPGWSWIEVKNKVHAFNAEDHSHPQCEGIYILLQQLNEGIKLYNNFVNQVLLLQCLDNLDGYDDLKLL
uniref:Pentatricopeptide repeat-containing protein At3g25970 n=1 Tax=Cajanus cajan TaxID=3821 RepID=A0A151UCZ8_CAJCA|nr:Putative pentatricopeptide repeat-containing protein At3g25970 [Cajanus cajan]